LIELIAKRIPERKFTSVELDSGMESPLDEILRQLPPDTDGPVMVLGLEHSCPSDAPFHPVLERLNLSRPRWPLEFPRAVVLWVPEYLLGLLGREAPDFLDWRSDTLYFSELTSDELFSVDLDLWNGGIDGRLPEERRRSRISELRMRLTQQGEAEDPVALKARASWLAELGNHLLFLGELDEAEEAYRTSLAIDEKWNHSRQKYVGYTNLAGVFEARGDFGKAEEMLRAALVHIQTLPDPSLRARALGNLGLIQLRFGRLEEAKDTLLQALQVNEAVAAWEDRAGNEMNLAGVYQELGDQQSAEKLLEKAVHFYRRSGNLDGLATGLANLANVAFRQGDLGRAEELFKEALDADRRLGKQQGVAHRYRGLGAVYAESGRFEEAEEMLRQALDIDQRLGYQPGVAVSLENLGIIAEKQNEGHRARALWTRALALYSEMGLTGPASRLQRWLASSNL
jgi:tetratricopeptide (TPR) repeat protein